MGEVAEFLGLYPLELPSVETHEMRRISRILVEKGLVKKLPEKRVGLTADGYIKFWVHKWCNFDPLAEKCDDVKCKQENV
jgi:hypothetical protein